MTTSQEQRRVPAIRMLAEQVSRLQGSWPGCWGMPATPQHSQPAAATTAGDILGPSDSALLCHSRAAGRAFSLSYPHNYSMARESIQGPDTPAAPRRTTHHHHQRQCLQKENVLLCPIMGSARMHPASASLPGTAAEHPHAPRRRKKRRGGEGRLPALAAAGPAESSHVLLIHPPRSAHTPRTRTLHPNDLNANPARGRNKTCC